MTVTPEDMHGWSIETNARGWGALCPWGLRPTRTTILAHRSEPMSHTPFPGGRGSFYATCDYFKATAPIIQNDNTPSTVWLGTDQWNGSPVAGRTLGSITEMDYYQLHLQGAAAMAGGKIDELEGGPRMAGGTVGSSRFPWTLTAESPDKTERRQFWYRPDGGNYVGDDGTG